jgi:thiosulfate dehydrogenase (quinone) large subunit
MKFSKFAFQGGIMSTQVTTSKGLVITDPPFARTLLENTRWAWLWLIVRLYVGYEWLNAGIEKLSSPAWWSGAALKGFWQGAIAIPPAPGRPAISYDWYRAFLTGLLNSGSYVWFAKLVNVAELLIGAALILGAFVGIAAFFGAFMNWNFMMAGTASINPVLIILSILLILAWKTAGWWGLDRWLLTHLGTPWRPRVE